MKKIFLTGSEGFVGQHVVNLLKNDYSIIGLSRATTLPSEENLTYEIGDILNQNKIYELLKKYSPDVILHLAGVAKTWGNNPQEVFNINLMGTLNLYEAISKLKNESDFDPKIIFISSAEVYGKTTKTDSITEDAPLFPINIYGCSKLAADRLSYEYSQTQGLKVTILRPFPHIGPGQSKGFFVPDMASQIVELERGSENELLVGNLDGVRDFLDVRDVAAAYKLVIEKDLEVGEVYNICSGKAVKIEEVLNKLLKLSKKQITIKKDPARIRPIDLPIFVGSSNKFSSKTGWQPKFTIDQTLKDVIDYWRNK